MKELLWYSTYLVFNGMSAILYGFIFAKCIEFIIDMPSNAWYFIQVTDLRKRDRFMRHQSQRFHIVLALAMGSIGLCLSYTIMLTETFIDSALIVSEHATWVAYIIFVMANICSMIMLYSIQRTVDLFISEERGEYEDGLKATFEGIEKNQWGETKVVDIQR